MATKDPKKFIIGGALYTLLFVAGPEQIGGKDTDNKCGGEERWTYKVLEDNEANNISETPSLTTIKDLTSINTKTKDAAYSEGRPRADFEKKVYTIKHCFITKVLRENDNDLHLVIEDGAGNTMIAEIPDPQCPDAKKSIWIEYFNDARATMFQYRSNFRHYMFTVTGVAFVDRSHGQTGKAPNNVEIHPILEIKKEKKINPIQQ